MNIEQIEKAISDYEQARKDLIEYIKTYCKAERGNMKRLAEKCGMNYNYLANTLYGKSAKIERLIWIAKKMD
jgi:transcriptional regulator with XRE-family HTH domain